MNPKPPFSPEPTAAPRPRSGAAMDRPLPARPPWRRWVWSGAVVLGVGLLALLLLSWREPGLRRLPQGAQLAPVQAGEFRDELALRARVEPLRTVQLDATEAGRVEAVLVREGALVKAGDPLFRLHSPEQEQQLLQRDAEVAQQMANASAQRSAQAATLAQHRRELRQLESAAEQADAEWQRQRQLAESGFIAQAGLEQAQRQQRLSHQLLSQAREDQRAEAEIRARALTEMDSAVARLQGGLKLLAQAQQRLLQRAPIAGQLSGFTLQVGASVRPGDKLGRIDDPAGGLQLVAEVDEFYLPRLRPGLEALSETHGRLSLAQTLPQVTGGKVRVLLRWPGPEGQAAAGPALRPGQAVELRLQFSAPHPALLLPDGPGVQSRLYVQDGAVLRRRDVQLGRRAVGRVEVLAGLRAGEQVLITPYPHDAEERLALP